MFTPLDFSDSSHTPTLTPKPTETEPCPSPKSTQSKKYISIVWSHFTNLEGDDPSSPQAKCTHCRKLYGCYYRKHGTLPLEVHLEAQCNNSLILKSLREKSQSRLKIGLKWWMGVRFNIEGVF